MPTIFLIDDDVHFAELIIKLAATIGLRVECFVSAESFLREFDARGEGCVMVDLDNPSVDGMRVIEAFTKSPRPIPVIALMQQDEVSTVVQAARFGIVTFLQKKLASSAEILDAIQSASKWDSEHRAASARLLELKIRFSKLNGGEREVLKLLLLGGELPVIATKLNVSRRTVDRRRASLMVKLDVKTFPALVAIATEYEKFAATIQ